MHYGKSMKQQNDYSLLIGEYYKQSIKINRMQADADSMNIAIHSAAREKKQSNLQYNRLKRGYILHISL